MLQAFQAIEESVRDRPKIAVRFRLDLLLHITLIRTHGLVVLGSWKLVLVGNQLREGRGDFRIGRWRHDRNAVLEWLVFE
jgi:hypothetical protein